MMDFLKIDQFEHFYINDCVLDIGICDVVLKKWTGVPICNSFGGKTLIDVDGKPLFAELAVVDWFISQGWDARWVCTYGRNKMNPLFLTSWSDCSVKGQKSKQFSNDKVHETLMRIAEINDNSFGGCWDVVAYKGEELLFVECKKYKCDRIRETQLKWLKSSLQYGLQKENFRILQWRTDI